MRPSALELVVRVRQAIDDAVLPFVEDKLAASSLRSAKVLLDHAAKLIELEAGFLAEDNADVRAVLAKAATELAGAEQAPALNAVLAEAEQSDPAKANDDYQRALEIALAAVRQSRAEALHADLRAYIARRIERERPMFFPAFSAAPF